MISEWKISGRKRPVWKAAFLFLVLVVMAAAVDGSALAEEDNLFENAGFERTDEEGIPEGWFREAYIQEAGYTRWTVETETVDGTERQVLQIRNFALNDARLAQVVEVEPEHLYRFSALVRADNVEEGHGANLSIDGIYAFSEELFDTEGTWKRIEWYGETGPDQYEATLFLRLGGYSGESLGTVWFTDVRLEEVEELPEDVVAARWFRITQPAVYEDDEDGEEEKNAAFWPWLLLMVFLYTVAAVCIMSWAFSRGLRSADVNRAEIAEKKENGPEWIVGICLLAAMMLRIVISWLVEGYEVDVNCFLSWGNTMRDAGPAGFYTAVSFCDYPPVYLLVLGMNSWIGTALHLPVEGMRVLFRLLPSMCDVIGCAVLYRAAVKYTQGKGKLTASIFVCLLAFNPATVLNSAAWSQIDSVLCLLLMLVALWAMNGKWLQALPCYMLAVLVKPQALMLGPLGLAAMICVWIREEKARKSMLAGIGISLAEAVAVILMFQGNQDARWIIRLYGNTLSSYPYATVNTANLYYLLGDNWRPIGNSANIWVLAVLTLLCAVCAVIWRRKTRKMLRGWRIEFTALICFGVWFLGCAVLKASWVWAGAATMTLAFVIVLSFYLRKNDISFLPYAGALLFILLYVFGIKMHERYLFPAFLLLGLAWVTTRDWRMLRIGLGLTVCLFLNEGIVLDNSIRLGSAAGHLNPDTSVLAGIISAVNILCAMDAVRTGLSMVLGETVAEEPGILFRTHGEGKPTGTFRADPGLHWTRADSALVAAMTIGFGIISLTTLGSRKAPQSGWASSGYDEQIVFDLGAQHDEAEMLYFAQVSMYDFSVAESPDGEHWGEEQWAQMDQQQCWKWKYVTESVVDSKGKRQYYNSGYNHILHFRERYIRISAHQVGLKLNEVLFRSPEGQILPAQILSRIGGNPESELYSDPAALLDEQDTLEGLPILFSAEETETASDQPSWWNSSYFDEIYHARTAFEFLRGSAPYETTHPPLGKVLISWGVALFGMTPFGWRLAGAVAGILMIPGMYLIGKQLTKSTAVAMLCAAFMALDCQHLTQTQIATIDSFPVLFIIFAFFFMLRFVQSDLITSRKRSLLIPLAASGCFMGLAIASKWIGIYAGAGLALLFFWHLGITIRQERKTADAESGSRKEKRALKVCMELCLWCLLFFIVQPSILYLLSYIPYMAYNTGIHGIGEYLAAVWQSQVGMLNYHSTKSLGMDHPFYSPWWEWPVIGKPMYYASESYELGNGLYFSIFCFGNPVVWFSGLVGLAGCLGFWLRGMLGRFAVKEWRERWAGAGSMSAAAFVLIGFLAQYLPWTLVPRGTYIYHYFASVPFLILAVGCCCRKAAEFRKRFFYTVIALLIVTALAGFILFFPYASGIMAPEGWLEIGRKILRIWY